jgi:hypothetical protein
MKISEEEEANILEIYNRKIHDEICSLWSEPEIQYSLKFCQQEQGLFENSIKFFNIFLKIKILFKFGKVFTFKI